MKIRLLAFSLSIGVLLSGCTGVRVANVEVASGATNPEAIYIRPFSMNHAAYRDGDNPNGAVRASLISVAFADMLEQQLGKIAPAMVIAEDEDAPVGWLVEGDIEQLDARSPSALRIHLRITDVGRTGIRSDSTKAGVSHYEVVRTENGLIVYEFDLRGGRVAKAPFNGIANRSGRESVYFDLENAAERVMLALSPNPFQYGKYGSPNQRN